MAGSPAGTDVDPVEGAFAHLVGTQPCLVQILVGNPAGDRFLLHLAPTQAVVGKPGEGFPGVGLGEDGGSSVGICPDVDMVTGTMYFIRYRLSLLCSIPAQAADFCREIPITAVAVHVAGAGVLVHIPAQGSVVGLPVIRQPDLYTGARAQRDSNGSATSWCWRTLPPSTPPAPWRCRRFGRSGCRRPCPWRRRRTLRTSCPSERLPGRTGPENHPVNPGVFYRQKVGDGVVVGKVDDLIFSHWWFPPFRCPFWGRCSSKRPGCPSAQRWWGH